MSNIRSATEDDADQILEIYSLVIVNTSISFEIKPPAAEEMKKRINTVINSHAWLVYDRGAKILEYAYAGQHRVRAAYQWSVDVSVYVHHEHYGQGIGKKLYTTLFRVLAAQGYYNAYAGITLPNKPSVSLHEKLGFHKIWHFQGVGFKHGLWRDVGWWHLPLRDKEKNPIPPISFQTLSLSLDLLSDT